MTLLDLTEALEDSATLERIAKRHGIPLSAVVGVAADFGEMPADSTTRICGTAARDRLRQINRATRKSEPREE